MFTAKTSVQTTRRKGLNYPNTLLERQGRQAWHKALLLIAPFQYWRQAGCRVLFGCLIGSLRYEHYSHFPFSTPLFVDELAHVCFCGAWRASPKSKRQPQAQEDVQDEDADDQLSDAELEQLVAPIALYPDALLSQVLMASTYPLEVVEAARWAQDNPKVKPDDVETALKDKDWDASVKSLAAIPDALAMLNHDLSWTQKLGDAFLAQQAEVLEAVQRLRLRAEEAGNLESSEEIKVEKVAASTTTTGSIGSSGSTSGGSSRASHSRSSLSSRPTRKWCTCLPITPPLFTAHGHTHPTRRTPGTRLGTLQAALCGLVPAWLPERHCGVVATGTGGRSTSTSIDTTATIAQRSRTRTGSIIQGTVGVSPTRTAIRRRSTVANT